MLSVVLTKMQRVSRSLPGKEAGKTCIFQAEKATRVKARGKRSYGPFYDVLE